MKWRNRSLLCPAPWSVSRSLRNISGMMSSKERRQNLCGRARIGERHRMRDECLHMQRCADPRQGNLDRYTDQHQRTEFLELACTGADVPHGAEVESEMADIRAVGANIGFLADHDVIDQTRGLCIVCREPRHLYARHVLQEPLQER